MNISSIGYRTAWMMARARRRVRRPPRTWRCRTFPGWTSAPASIVDGQHQSCLLQAPLERGQPVGNLPQRRIVELGEDELIERRLARRDLGDVLAGLVGQRHQHHPCIVARWHPAHESVLFENLGLSRDEGRLQLYDRCRVIVA